MATVVRTFDLYNTTFYWLGYNIDGFDMELSVARAYYYTNFSSNIIGSQIDFFSGLGGINNYTNNVFTLSTTLNGLSALWKRYWWDEAIYYSHPIALNAIKTIAPQVYRDFSESVGSLYYISRYNNLSNNSTVIYNPIIDPLLPPGVSSAINSFYKSANTLFNTNIANIVSATGSLVMADADLTRRITSNLSLTAAVNTLYSPISSFLPYNTNVIGNLLTPYYWSVSANCEDVTINVSINNTTTSIPQRITNTTLIAIK